MFKNYYLFKNQVREIQSLIVNSIIFSVYTVHKNEIIFELKSAEKELHLKINIGTAQPYIFITDPVNYKTSRFNLFDELYGQEITSFKIIPNNKYLIFDLNHHIMSAYFFGPEPNVIIVEKNTGQFKNSFKSIKKMEYFEHPSEQKSVESPAIKDISEIVHSSKGRLKELAKVLFPSANNKMVSELEYRLEKLSHSNPKGNGQTNLLKVLQDFHGEINGAHAFIHRKEHSPMYLLLYSSKKLSDQGYDIEVFSSINKAWIIFNQQSQKALATDKLYNQLSTIIARRRKSLEVALEKLKEAENIEERKTIADLKGNLILTNKHKIPRGSAHVELINIFSAEQEHVEIKLNPKKTAVENATYYFEKYKNAAEKKHILKIKKTTHLQEIKEISLLGESIETASIKDLFKIREQLINMNILQSDQIKQKNPEALKYSFKRLILEKIWDIYIGKNNLNNELLTFSFAKKSDLWLHAQGVSGSHVIIKVPKNGATVPKSIIEKAAQFAASNSKAKHSSTVPVIYTEVRHVSKIKKAPAGTVKVLNEKVVFVKPLNLN